MKIIFPSSEQNWITRGSKITKRTLDLQDFDKSIQIHPPGPLAPKPTDMKNLSLVASG